MKEEDKKPCIQCGKECDILPVELGDFFTLTYLRVCGPECMFLVAYDYLYEIGYHKSFRGHLYDKQNDEDKAARDKFVDEATKESLRLLGESFKANPGLLTQPAPDIHKLFSEASNIPCCSGQTMRFTRPTKKQKIAWQTDRVERLKKDLEEAIEELEKTVNG